MAASLARDAPSGNRIGLSVIRQIPGYALAGRLHGLGAVNAVWRQQVVTVDRGGEDNGRPQPPEQIAPPLAVGAVCQWQASGEAHHARID